MKVIIMSDTHGSDTAVDTIFAQEPERDLVIHLGDYEGRDDYIRAVAECPVEFVAGNCDWQSTEVYEKILSLGPHRVFLTHGSGYAVSYSKDRLVYAAREKGCDVAMFGHTHRPFREIVDGIQLINPGSAAHPRGGGKTYMVMHVDRSGATYELKGLV